MALRLLTFSTGRVGVPELPPAVVEQIDRGAEPADSLCAVVRQVPDGRDWGFAVLCARHQWASATTPRRSELDHVACPYCAVEIDGHGGRERYAELHARITAAVGGPFRF